MSHSPWFRAGCRLLCALASAASAYAQAPVQLVPSPDADGAGRAAIVREAGGRATVRATRVVLPIRIDGHLDERVYEDVAPMSGFLQAEPHTGEPATETTEVWLLFDDRN